MKLSAIVLLAASASAKLIRNASVKRSLLSQARRLEDAGDDYVANNEYGFLSKYDLKLIACLPDVQYTNPESGETEYSSVLFRLCPSTTCSDDNEDGCGSGYGDYVVGIASYANSWLEDKRDNWNGDDNFKVEDYSECREYDFRDNDDDDETVYYVGPTCASDGRGIGLGFFTDETCTTVSERSFESKTNGWTLPYSSGNLVTTACESCSGYNDKGNFEVSEMCTNFWMYSSARCETNMAYVSANGLDESGCESVAAVTPEKAKVSHAGAAIGWTLFALVIVGAAGYAYVTWWMKRKHSASGLASDGVMN